MTTTSEQVRQNVLQAITDRGVEDVRKGVCGTLQKMVTVTRFKREFGTGKPITIGFDNIDPTLLEVAVNVVLEAMPDDEKKAWLQTDLEFWKEHRTEILMDHDITVQ
ncbi:MAG: hypothetical protein O3A36_03780 [bacterium]|nr:hypothetical protein [bacterium]